MTTVYSKNRLSFLKIVVQNTCFSTQKSTLVSVVNRNKKIKILDLNKSFLIRPKERFNSTFSKYVSNGLNYVLAISIGLSGGLAAGFWFVHNQSKNLVDANEDVRPMHLVNDFQPTKYIEHKESAYKNFPLKIHLYQYECCPYSSQVKAYLDYFGFNYTLTEVDSFSKEELTKFTKIRLLPIVVLEDKINKRKWHLTNATSILSALESVRNDKHINFKKVLDQHLPLLKDSGVVNQNKYVVSNSDLNSVELRKWINNKAIPIFSLNSVDNLKDLFERFDCISEKSGWKIRYNTLKYYYIYYSNVLQTYQLYSSILNRLSPQKRQLAPRELLDKTLTRWESELGNNSFVSGTDKPNLADISMFGNVRAYEGCTVFRESIAKYPKFRKWYEKMNFLIYKGYQQVDKKSVAFVTEGLDDFLEERKPEPKIVKQVVVEEKKIDKVPNVPKAEKIAEIPKVEKFSEEEKNIKMNEKVIFRVLSATYLIHVIAFTFAAYNK